MHKLGERTLITPTLLRFIQGEAEKESRGPHYYSIIQKRDGSFVEHCNLELFPSATQIIFGRDMLNHVHRELAHDGAWVFFLTHPARADAPHAINEWLYSQFHFAWMDKEGDMQLSVTWEKGGEIYDFAQVLTLGWTHWANVCETAWQTWNQALNPAKVMGLHRDQQIAAAQGERVQQRAPDDATLH